MHRHETGRCRPSRARTIALRSSAAEPRTDEKKKSDAERIAWRRGRDARESTRWNLDESESRRRETSERRMADRNEDFNWYRGPRRSFQSFYYRFFCLFLFLFSLPFFNFPSVLYYTFRERFTKIAYLPISNRRAKSFAENRTCTRLRDKCHDKWKTINWGENYSQNNSYYII